MTDSEGYGPPTGGEAVAVSEEESRAEYDDALLREALDEANATSWLFQDLSGVLDGKVKRTEATMFRRSDGVPLLYPGKTHAFVGEAESMKSWAALAACAERLNLDEVVLYIDFEDDKITFVERLLAMGVSKDAIRDKAAYIRPIEPLENQETRHDIGLVGKRYGNPTLVVLDGVTECMMLHGWDPNVGTDVARFLEFYPRKMASTGAALIFIDHVPKSKGSHERYAIGSVHKLNGIDGASYTFEIKRPFGRGMEGVSAVFVNKDRPGFVRPHADKKKIAEMHAVSAPENGAVTITLDPPVTGEDWRPTVLMERISKLLEGSDAPLSTRQIRENVTGQSRAKDQAITFLIEEGYVATEPGPRNAVLHGSVMPYRQPAERTNYEALASHRD